MAWHKMVPVVKYRITTSACCNNRVPYTYVNLKFILLQTRAYNNIYVPRSCKYQIFMFNKELDDIKGLAHCGKLGK